MPVSSEAALPKSTIYRVLTAAMGLLFTGVAVYALLSGAARDPAKAVATLVLGGLGVNALLAAVRARSSWLARIAPLP